MKAAKILHSNRIIPHLSSKPGPDLDGDMCPSVITGAESAIISECYVTLIRVLFHAGYKESPCVTLKMNTLMLVLFVDML